MAILMTMDVPGGTIEMYEQVNELLGISGTEDAPDGLIGHVCATTETGIRIVDVWESREALETFLQTRALAAFEQVGVPQTEPQIHTVHNGIRGRSAAAA
jgi:quinol monooxygenase YgiN